VRVTWCIDVVVVVGCCVVAMQSCSLSERAVDLVPCSLQVGGVCAESNSWSCYCCHRHAHG
jgi:hypothetical protein